tara:strand:- start:221 stop:622 length:402 start_codon:yes stop_codon:yes gene_type:complete
MESEMSNLKTGLMYSELSSKVYWGTVNQKTGIARAGKKDVTSDFIGVMLKKFPVGFKQNIECNGKVEAVVIVVDEEKANKYSCAGEMYDEIKQDIVDLKEFILTLNEQSNDWLFYNSKLQGKSQLLAKARGES